MARIDIVSGFLGAGKTTLIQKLIQEAFQGEKLVLIENEYGEVGIDGGFLKESGITISELNSGCICCTLVGDFAKNMREVVATYHPDRIIVEPSGVGKLSDVMNSVVEVSEELGLELASLITVVNGKKALKQMKAFGEFFNNQVENATTIVLSRTQEMDEAKLEECVHVLQEKNVNASIITTPWDQLNANDILNAAQKKEDMMKELLHEVEHHHHEHDHHDHECGCGHHHEHDHHDHECGCGHHHEHDHHDHECGCGHHYEHDHHDHECGCGHHHDHEHHDHEHHECGCGHHHEHEHHHDHECGCGHHHDHEHHDHEHHECGCGHHHDHDHHDHECGCGHHHDHDHHDHECGCGHHHEHDHHHADEVFISWGIETPHKFERAIVEKALDTLCNSEKYESSILRAKGMIEATDGTWIYFDMVPGDYELRSGQPDSIGRLVVIGTKVDEAEMKALFVMN